MSELNHPVPHNPQQFSILPLLGHMHLTNIFNTSSGKSRIEKLMVKEFLLLIAYPINLGPRDKTS